MLWTFVFSIDATDVASFGKYINDSLKPNSRIKVIEHRDRPLLAVFALGAEIKCEEEITSYYGDLDSDKMYWRQVGFQIMNRL